MTNVLHGGHKYVWQACFHITLLAFRQAVVRKCAKIRRHYIHRHYTPLTEVVPKEERERYSALAEIGIDGQYKIGPAFERAISRAEAQREAIRG